MKNNLFFYSQKLGSQPLLWRQAVSGSPYRGWSLFNIIFYPIMKPLYKKKNHPSLLLDQLIVGNNPIINALLIYQLSKQCMEKDIRQKVGILITKQPDYWAYDSVRNAELFSIITKKTGLKVTKVEDLFDTLFSNISSEYLEIVIIKEEDLVIKYAKHDEFINGWIFHLFFKKKQDQVNVEDYINFQNDIKEMIYEKFSNSLQKYKLSKKIKWNNVDEVNYPIVLTPKVYLSSIPQGWINMNSQVIDSTVYFEHDLTNYSFGTARKIPTKIKNFTQISLSSIEDISL